MDFHHLKYFVEVADKKSFSKAARTLHISQSAISRTIKALEEELGVVLFMRNAKAVELTDAGTIFLSHAKRVVFMFEHLKTDFENEFKLEQGTVLIGLPPITGAPIFANLLGAFKQEYPQIELDLYEHGSKKVEISVHRSGHRLYPAEGKGFRIVLSDPGPDERHHSPGQHPEQGKDYSPEKAGQRIAGVISRRLQPARRNHSALQENRLPAENRI